MMSRFWSFLVRPRWVIALLIYWTTDLLLFETLLSPSCHGFSAVSPNVGIGYREIADELSADKIEQVNAWLSYAMGDKIKNNNKKNNNKNNDTDTDSTKSWSRFDRYAGARSLAYEMQTANSQQEGGEHLSVDPTTLLPSPSPSSSPSPSISNFELVYGELSIPTLATILDAVGVRKGERFLDIGSGDGALVLGACLLYPDHIEKSYGIELVPGLVQRSRRHWSQLKEFLVDAAKEKGEKSSSAFVDSSLLDRVEFMAGNVYEVDDDPDLSKVLADTTLAVCFATTWSQGNANANAADVDVDDDCYSETTTAHTTKSKKSSVTSLNGRRLSKLSFALAKKLSKGCKIVIIDGKLDETHGYVWGGDLKVNCPDTVPYSIASLYTRI